MKNDEGLKYYLDTMPTPKPAKIDVLIVGPPAPPASGAYAEGHQQGYEDGFKQAAAMLEIERDDYRKNQANWPIADAMTHCWVRMNNFLAGRLRRGFR